MSKSISLWHYFCHWWRVTILWDHYDHEHVTFKTINRPCQRKLLEHIQQWWCYRQIYISIFLISKRTRILFLSSRFIRFFLGTPPLSKAGIVSSQEKILEKKDHMVLCGNTGGLPPKKRIICYGKFCGFSTTRFYSVRRRHFVEEKQKI